MSSDTPAKHDPQFMESLHAIVRGYRNTLRQQQRNLLDSAGARRAQVGFVGAKPKAKGVLRHV